MQRPAAVTLVEYSAAQERANCLTHAAGAVCAAVCFAAALMKTVPTGSARRIVAAAVYCAAFLTVYVCSAVYHGLRPGPAKRTARRLDHMAIPLLLAGTATPCALISLHRVSPATGTAVFVIAWVCAAFGVISKLFLFESKLFKTLCMVVYFTGGAVMMLLAVPLLGQIDRTAFLLLTAGCLLYAAGAVFCRIGMRRPWFHTAFHVLVLLGSLVQFGVIYHYVL
ncbi:MAG: hemolysin III family protein [Clostridia bacterium]|nr:hemolysin III family protein [Clostridia bacterium]